MIVGGAILAGIALGRFADGAWVLPLGGGIAAVAGLGAFRLARHLREAELAALTDPLTKLPNRVLLADRVEQAIKRSRRTGEPFAVVALDLDGFKAINDGYGHAAGDEVLSRLARRLESAVRASDTVARVGGDEFVLLSLGSRDEHEVAALVGRLRQELRRPFELGDDTPQLDGSIGWALHPSDGATATELLDRADELMLSTKRDGRADRGRPRRPASASVMRSLESELHRGRIVVHYQPVVEPRTGAPRRMEALVRGCATGRGVLTPVEIGQAVDRTPLVSALALYAVGDALRQAGEWRGAGLPLGVSVRVPLRVLGDEAFVDELARLLNQARTPADELTVEVSPEGSALVGEADAAMVAAVGRLGTRIALTDVIRSSAASALGSLPLDEIKIDATFVRGLTTAPADAAIVKALVEVGRELGFTVTGDGVESFDAYETLAQLGCDLAQGFFVGAPMPADEVTAWAASRAVTGGRAAR
jgi:diguanylate cyclase (GGDEF)-like protein